MTNFRYAFLSLCLAFISVAPGFSQTSPCSPGTLANVLGTSCSVGPIVFNFQSTFNGSGGPADIGFIPIRDGIRDGFKLLTNFADTCTGSTLDVSHLFQFSYTPQAQPGFEIRIQGLSMVAAAQAAASSTGFVQVLDFQAYPNSTFGPTVTDTAIDIENNATLADELSNNVFLEAPGLFSTGSGLPNTATTQLFDFCTGSASASLTAATFLYTTGPIVPAPALAALTYTNIDLPGETTTFASNIINTGTIVGFYQDASGVFHGYVTNLDGTFTTIDAPGATETFAGGLNERGDVVGSYDDSAGVSHGFLFRQGSFTTVDPPGAIFTVAIGINDEGQIVGEYETADEGFHGFLLDHGVFTTIDHGPGTGAFANTEADAINDSGVIAGNFFDPNTFFSFTQIGELFQKIDVPGQGNTLADGINDAGVLVGTYDDINLVQHGFVGPPVLFNTVDFPGGNNTFAFGVNIFGNVVGIYSDSAGNTHSFLAQPARGNTLSGAERAAVSFSTGQPQRNTQCGTEKARRLSAKLRGSLCR